MDTENKEEMDKSETESLETSLKAERQRAEDYLTQLKYARADLENLKKRHDREMEETKKYCNERIITMLLEIVDELELATSSARNTNSAENLVQGVEMTLKKLRKILENEGVTQIRCLDERFDPSKHDVIEKTEKQGVKECIVTEEVRKGYMMREKVIRPSIVKVVMQPSNSQKGDEIK